MGMWKNIAMTVCCLLLICACGKTVSTASAPSGTLEPVPVQASAKQIMVSESDGKTTVDIPVQPEAQTYADYTSKRISIAFVPSVHDFSLPVSSSSLVQNIDKIMDGDRVSAVDILLSAEAKFLLSKPEPGISRVLLVPDTAIDKPKAMPAAVNAVSALNFAAQDGNLVLTTISSFPYEIVPEQGENFKLILSNTQLQPGLLKRYDVSKLGTSATAVIAQHDAAGNSVLQFPGTKSPHLSVRRTNDQTSITIAALAANPGQPVSASPAGPEQAKQDDSDPQLQELNTLFPGMKENYSGEKISIDLQDADVEHILRLISEISGYNLILDEGVTGKISLKLTDIPWDQALDLILLQRGLGIVLKGNIMRIAPIATLNAERAQLQEAREAAVRARESMENLAPLKTEYIQINYNTADDFKPKIDSMLTPRGKSTADTRTNMLIVTDTEQTLKRIESFIKKLDRPERQVLIEARLVYATDEFQRSLGVQWGTDYSTQFGRKDYQGNIGSTGLNMLDTVNGVTLGGSVGKIIGEDLFSLDVSLQLGEQNNLVKTISSPRILTLNNSRAEIQQGTKLATSGESESGGTTTEYEEAVLKISVLPQITPDNKLILDLEINDDSPKSDGRDIDTRQTKTKMMVGDKETIVIGGVQKTTESSGVNKVPALGDIPGLGWLFKNKYSSNSKQELLIFIHPRIL